jgi:hypothetical protein
MADFNPLKYAQALMNMTPSQGGLNYADYPHQYQNPNAMGGGLRTWQDKQGNWQGQMMPKTSGWQGEIQAIDPQQKITEYSMGGEGGEPFFPSVTQNMTPQQIQNVRLLEAGKLNWNSPEAKSVQDKAYQEYLNRKSQGLSAFKDYN